MRAQPVQRLSQLPISTAVSSRSTLQQLCMCLAIWSVAFIVHLVQCSTGSNAGFAQPSAAHSCPQFEPLAAVGGAIWCLSNLLLVPLIDTIGIGETASTHDACSAVCLRFAVPASCAASS